MKKSPTEVARLLVANALKYAQTKDKSLRRFTVTKKVVRIIANRKWMQDTDPFWNDLSDALLEYDHVMFPVTANDTKIAVMHKQAMNNWITLSDRYVRDLGPSDIDKLLEFWETEPDIADDVDHDGE